MGEQREQVSFCFPTLSVMQMHLQKPCNFRYLGNGNGGSLGSKKKTKTHISPTCFEEKIHKNMGKF
jgi:hypothetical protein